MTIISKVVVAPQEFEGFRREGSLKVRLTREDGVNNLKVGEKVLLVDIENKERAKASIYLIISSYAGGMWVTFVKP